MKSFIQNNSNCLTLVKKGKTPFMQENYYKIKKVKNYIEKNKMNPRKSGVLNEIVKYLKNNTLLPAICFVTVFVDTSYVVNCAIANALLLTVIVGSNLLSFIRLRKIPRK